MNLPSTTYVTLLSSELQLREGDCFTRLDCFKIAVTNDLADMSVWILAIKFMKQTDHSNLEFKGRDLTRFIL
jgi:hypothetical protein